MAGKGIPLASAALVMALWLIPVRWPSTSGGIPAEQQQEQIVNFLKNVAIMGGLLILAYASTEKTEAKA